MANRPRRAAAPEKTPDKTRLKEQGFYHWPVWRRLRRLALQRDRYLCQDCLEKGVIRTATEVHHVAPVDERPELALELDNLRSLCWECHERTKHRGGGGGVRAPEGVRVIAVRGGGDAEI